MRKSCLRVVFGLLLVLVGRPETSAAELNAAFNSITRLELKTYIDVLADDRFEGREAGSRGGRAAGAYLAKRLKEFGLTPAGDRGGYYQAFLGDCRNVLGVLKGSHPDLKDEYVLIGAHYDHVGYGTAENSFGPRGYIHNGADDNASGVAALLEVIGAFQTLGEAPKRSVLLALWDGEEKGLLGSKHWVANPTVPIGDVVFAIHADMIGRLRGRELKVIGTRTSRGLRRLVSRQNQATDLVVDFPWEMTTNSDHHTFYTKGIPVLMLHTGLHEDFHRPSDDPHKIDHAGTQLVARLLFSLAMDLANRPALNSFRSESRDERPSDRTAFERPLPPRPPRLGISWQRRDGDSRDVLVTRVFPDTPAERAGLRPGDRLVSFAGQTFDDDEKLQTAILATPSPAAAVVQRGEEKLELSVQLEGVPLRLGISWREDDSEPGTLTLSRVVPGSAAHLAGLKVADRIYEIAGTGFSDESEFLRSLSAAGGPTELLVERRGRLHSVTVHLPPTGYGE
jgi:hypothetical protein